MGNSDRDAIMRNLRGNSVAEVPLPTVYRSTGSDADDRQLFEQRLNASGGELLVARGYSEIRDALTGRHPDIDSTPLFSSVPEVAQTNQPEEWLCDPQSAQHLQLAVVRGKIAVAENAAVWMEAESVPHRAVPFLAQHLAIVVPLDALVGTLHEAYAELAKMRSNTGWFIAGPSKTADIAQCLVIGAQGPRSCLVCFVEQGG